MKNNLSKNDWKAWGKNLLWFFAPTIGVFFAQLALGVNWRIAAGVALLAFYSAIADLFKKYREGR